MFFHGKDGARSEKCSVEKLLACLKSLSDRQKVKGKEAVLNPPGKELQRQNFRLC